MASIGCLAAVTRLGQRRCLSLCASSLSSSLHSAHTTHRQPFSRRFISSAALASSSLSCDSVSQRLQSTSASLSLLPVVVECACASRPHPDKTEGEDTYSVHASPSGVTLAVYDGVGSWSFEQGVDVSLFSKRIKRLTDQQLAASSSSHDVPLPSALLGSVWRRLSADRVLGSCTACIVSLSASSEGGRLEAVTLGDSGFLVLRKRREGEAETDATEWVDDDNSQLSVITAYSSSITHQLQETNGSHPHSSASSSYYVHYRSLQQLHYFNCPFQLGFTADSAPSSSPFDLPSSALSASLPLRPDDVVVLSSDGLFDNLDEQQIVQLVSNELTAGRTVNEVAASLASAAFDRSVDKRVDGPFAAAAKDHNIMWSGGRKDDITVLIAHLTVTDDS